MYTPSRSSPSCSDPHLEAWISWGPPVSPPHPPPGSSPEWHISFWWWHTLWHWACEHNQPELETDPKNFIKDHRKECFSKYEVAQSIVKIEKKFLSLLNGIENLHYVMTSFLNKEQIFKKIYDVTLTTVCKLTNLLIHLLGLSVADFESPGLVIQTVWTRY